MRNKLEIVFIAAFIACLAWIANGTAQESPTPALSPKAPQPRIPEREEPIPSKTSPPSLEQVRSESKVVSAALDFFWKSNYGIDGDFFVFQSPSAVPFPRWSGDCAFYDPPPREDLHQIRIDRLQENLAKHGLESWATVLRMQNSIRVVWDTEAFDSVAVLRSTNVVEKAPSSGEFYNQTDLKLRQVNGRARLELSRPAVIGDRALVFAIDHREWPSRALLVLLERQDGEWRGLNSYSYPQPSYCKCGP